MKKIALLALVAAAMMAPLSASGRPATQGQTKGCSPIGPTWLQDFGPTHSGADVLKHPAQFAVMLNSGDYGCIPKVTVTLFLPKGSTVVKQKLRFLGTNANLADYRFTRNKAGRPVWVVKHLKENPTPIWVFWVSSPTAAQRLCLNVTARIEGVKDSKTQPGTQDCTPEM